MNQIIKQLRRIYTDDGRGDRDFSRQEALLREAELNLIYATQELVRASQRLSDVVLEFGLAPNYEPLH